MSKLEIKITNNIGYTTVVDVLDFPFRLNKTSFTTSKDKLKSLGGVTSTNIKLAKSKRNNRLFFGKGEFDDHSKFNNLTEYSGVIYENGAEIARGTFSFDEGSISFGAYEGTFYGEDIDWVSRLENTKLNKLDYVDGKPTWLVPFDGAITFNAVNDLSNTDTDFICPTLVYNNTPIADYLDLTDDEVWGTFDMSDPQNPKRLTPAFNINDFVCETGKFGDRLGLTFDSFPPAVNYKNLIVRIFNSIGVGVDCPLFNEDWFNAIYLPYVGEGYKYNWKNLATAASATLFTTQVNKLEFDEIHEAYDVPVVNIDPLTYVGEPDYVNWIDNTKVTYKQQSLIKNDDPSISSVFKDNITAFNKFGIDGQYIAPVDGRYTIKAKSGYRNIIGNNFVEEFDSIAGSPIRKIWDGQDLFDSYATQGVGSQKAKAYNDRFYGWDDSVLVILRRNESNDLPYTDTFNDLYKWMGGVNEDFINNPSDVIAYISPKRWELYDAGFILDSKRAFGSPLTNSEETVTINSAYHSSFAPNQSASFADIEIEIDLKKNERVDIFWTSLADIEGNVNIFASGYPFFAAWDFESTQFIGDNWSGVPTDEQFFKVDYNCGEYDLDLAKNLPNINCKQFVSNFITQYNLFSGFSDGILTLTPQKQQYSKKPYDITSRVVANSWVSKPLPTPKTWKVGYTIDEKDRLLTSDTTECSATTAGTNNYGNVEFENPNTTSNDELVDYNGFSSTKFFGGSFVLVNRNVTGTMFPITTPDPASDVQIIKGIKFYDTNATGENDIKLPFFVPSIQSKESFNQTRLGDLTYDYNYNPRLIYHLGTINNFLPPPANIGLSILDYQVFVDSPRAEHDFVIKQKHWFKPTVSQFDYENDILTGVSYPSMRYDRTTYDDGLYIKYYDNLIQLYNESEFTSLDASLRSVDWNEMDGSALIRYRDQTYRLSKITGYNPKDNTPCTVLMVKDI